MAKKKIKKGSQIDLPKKTDKGLLTEKRLRDAAIVVFSRNGFHNTKVSDIVSEAELSQPAFYLYFESKEATYTHLVESFRANLKAATETNFIDQKPPPKKMVPRVAESFERFLDLMWSDSNLTEIGFFQPPGCSITKQQMVSWVAKNMTKEQKAGIWRKDLEAIDMARLLVGLLDQYARLDSKPIARKRYAEICAKLFCGACCA